MSGQARYPNQGQVALVRGREGQWSRSSPKKKNVLDQMKRKIRQIEGLGGYTVVPGACRGRRKEGWPSWEELPRKKEEKKDVLDPTPLGTTLHMVGIKGGIQLSLRRGWEKRDNGLGKGTAYVAKRKERRASQRLSGERSILSALCATPNGGAPWRAANRKEVHTQFLRKRRWVGKMRLRLLWGIATSMESIDGELYRAVEGENQHPYLSRMRGKKGDPDREKGGRTTLDTSKSMAILVRCSYTDYRYYADLNSDEKGKETCLLLLARGKELPA